jgi:hypothetical protein
VLQQQQQHGASYEGQVPPQPHRREGEDQLMSKFVPSASIVHDFTFSFLVLDIVLFSVVDPYPDPGGRKWPRKIENSK